jgi:CMP-N-acetylneuraminic acid synthetase
MNMDTAPYIHAILPVRGGSERVPNKNMRPFAGSTLLEIKVRQLLAVPSLAGVHVSSEDRTMLDLAERLGATPHERDPYFATSSVPMSEVYAYMAGQVDADHVMLTHVTNPMADSELYERMIAMYGARGEAFDSMTTVAEVKEFLYLDRKPLNFDPANKPRSQDLPNIVKLTHVVSIAPREMVVSTKQWFGPQVSLVKLDAMKSLDIDTPLDMEIAEWLYMQRFGG